MNGVFDLWFAQSWMLNFFAPDEVRRRASPAGIAPEARARRATPTWPGARSRSSPRGPRRSRSPSFGEYRTLAPYYYEWLKHPNYDDYWAKVDVEAQWDKIKVPALISGGWGDLFALGSVRGFKGLRAHGGSPAARSGTMLIMQPGGHGGDGVHDYGPAADRDVRALQLRFFDHYMKGVDNGIDREPRVQLFVQVPPDSGTQGSGFWIDRRVVPAGRDPEDPVQPPQPRPCELTLGRRRARSRPALRRPRGHSIVYDPKSRCPRTAAGSAA